jgi:hypothetical protein
VNVEAEGTFPKYHIIIMASSEEEENFLGLAEEPRGALDLDLNAAMAANGSSFSETSSSTTTPPRPPLTVEMATFKLKLPSESVEAETLARLERALSAFSDEEERLKKGKKKLKGKRRDPLGELDNTHHEDYAGAFSNKREDRREKRRRKRSKKLAKKGLTVLNIEIEGVTLSTQENQQGFTLVEPPYALSPRSRAAFAKASLKEEAEQRAKGTKAKKKKKAKSKKRVHDKDDQDKKKRKKRKKRRQRKKKRRQRKEGDSEDEAGLHEHAGDEADDNYFPTLAALRRRRRPYISVNKPVPCSICQV